LKRILCCWKALGLFASGGFMDVQMMVIVHGAEQAHLIKQLSEKTHELGGKWLNSKISHIDNYFAGLIKIEIAAQHIDSLIDQFKALHIHVETAKLDLHSQGKSQPFILNIDAKDRFGLVNDISEVLGENDIQIESMECHRIGGMDIGGIVFKSEFKISAGNDFNEGELIKSLQTISKDLVINLHA
jgi:glycine cleavage system regulatory protein